MNEDEKYLFDLTGYIVVKNVLDEEALARCNEAIDHYGSGIRERTQSLAGSATALRGITGRGELSGMLGWELPGGSRSGTCWLIRALCPICMKSWAKASAWTICRR